MSAQYSVSVYCLLMLCSNV